MGPPAHHPQGNPVIARFVLVGATDWAPLIEELERRGHEALASSSFSGEGEILVGWGEAATAVRRWAAENVDVADGLGFIAPEPAEIEGSGTEPAIVVAVEGSDLSVQREQARMMNCPVAQVPGGPRAHIVHPALVATLLVNNLVSS